MTGTGEEGGDDINAAFEELIAREWPDAPPPAPGNHPDPAPAELFDWVDPAPGPPAEPEYTLDHVEPDPEPDAGDWRPAPAPLEERFSGLSPLGALGAGLLVLSLLCVVGVVLFPSLRGVAGVLAVLAFAGGLGLLFSRLPRHRPPSDGDGAVV